MKKLYKKIISIVLSVFLILTVIPNNGKVNRVEAASGSQIVAEARKWIGRTPYVYEGNSLISGADCSGFVCAVFENCGINYWRYRGDFLGNASSVGTLIGTDTNQAKAGDIVVYPGHVGIAVDSNTIIQCQNDYGAKEQTYSYMQQWWGNVRGIIRPHLDSSPTGYLDSVIFSTNSPGKITVKGWAYDPDRSSQSIDVHIYVGGPAGTAGAECHVVKANKDRSDVNKACGISGKHGFEETFSVDKLGNQAIYAYGIDITSAGNNFPALKKSGTTVKIMKRYAKPDPPTAKSVSSTSITLNKKDGYIYSINGGDFVDTATFSGLKPGTKYKFYALRPGKGNYIASKPSDVATIKTKGYLSWFISLFTKNVKVQKGKSTKLSASVYPANAALTWTSSNTKIATVDSNGKVTGKKNGKVTITVKAKNYSSSKDTCTVEVVTTKSNAKTPSAPSAPKLSSAGTDSIILQNNVNYEYKIDNGSWQASPIFNNLQPGTAYIFYARVRATENNKASKASLPASFSTKSIMHTSDNYEPYYDGSYDDNYVDPGSGSGYTPVPEPPKEVKVQSLSFSQDSIEKFSKVDLKSSRQTWFYYDSYVNISPSNATNKELSWSISNDKVVELENAHLRMRSPGTATLTCTAKDGSNVSASLIINVISDGESASNPSAKSITSSSIELFGEGDYLFKMNDGEWQKSALFTNLEPKTEYKFYRIHKEDDYHINCKQSSMAKIKTLEKYSEVELITSGEYGYFVENGYALIAKYTGSEEKLTIPESIDGIPVKKICGINDPKGSNYNINGYSNKWNNVKEIIIPDSVDEIKGYAFSDSKIEKVTMSNNITEIGGNAFARSQLKEIELPNSLVTIGERAFSLSQLPQIEIPGSVEEIMLGAFSGCPLREVTFNEGLKKIGGYNSKYGVGCFDNTYISKIVLPDSVETIESNAFAHNILLTSVKLPDNPNLYIGEWAFQDCPNLTELNIPGAINITGSMFEGCNSKINIDENNENYKSVDGSVLTKDGKTLISVPNSANKEYHIPEGVESICTGCFTENTKIEKVFFPDSVYSLPDAVFKNCTSLKEVYLSKNINEISDEAFYNCYSLEKVDVGENIKKIGKNAFYKCALLESVDFPETITEIDDYAFYYCTKLNSITGYNNLVRVGNYAFESSGISEFNVPESLESIGIKAFCNTNLKEVILPATCTSVGDSAFANCYELIEVSVYNSMENYGERIFESCKNLQSAHLEEGVVYVPELCFAGDELLSDFTISSTVMTFKLHCLIGCYSIKELVIPQDSALSEYHAKDSGYVGVGIQYIYDYCNKPHYLKCFFINYDGNKRDSYYSQDLYIFDEGCSPGIVINSFSFDYGCSVHDMTDRNKNNYISIDNKLTKMKRGDFYQISANLSDLVKDKTIYWSSQNQGIISVDENGKVLAIKSGTETVSAYIIYNNTKYYAYTTFVVNSDKEIVNIDYDAPELVSVDNSNIVIKGAEGAEFGPLVHYNSEPEYYYAQKTIDEQYASRYYHDTYGRTAFNSDDSDWTKECTVSTDDLQTVSIGNDYAYVIRQRIKNPDGTYSVSEPLYIKPYEEEEDKYITDSNGLNRRSIFKNESTDDYIYNIDYNGEIIITNYVGNEKEVVVPERINGIKVSYIATTNTHGFNKPYDSNRWVGVEKVTVPSSVTLGVGAFESASSLKEIEYSSIVSNPDYVFANTNMEKIVFPEGMVYVPESTCRNDYNLKEIVLPSTVKYMNIRFMHTSGNNMEKIYINANKAPTITYEPSYTENDLERYFTSITSAIIVPANATGYDVYPWNQLNIVYANEENSISSIELSVEKSEMMAGEEQTISYTTLPEDAVVDNVKWESSDPDIAKVEDGKIIAYSAGDVNIKCYSEVNPEISAVVSIRIKGVSNPPESISVDELGDDYIILEKQEGCVYSLNGGEWTDNNEFNDLSFNTEYTISCKHAENDYYLESTAVEAKIKTLEHTHKWDEGVVTTEPACEIDGVKTHTCTKCGEKTTETIEKTYHNVEELPEVEVSCTVDGVTAGSYCTKCGKVFTEQIVTTPALGHDWQEIELLEEATCAKEGKKLCKCSRCGEEAEMTISKCQHTIVVDEAVEPTTTTTGLTAGTHCSVCGEVFSKQQVIPVKTDNSDIPVENDNPNKSNANPSNENNSNVLPKNVKEQTTTNDDSSGGEASNGNSSTGSSSNSGNKQTLKKYCNEWINGKWYDENGNQTYSGTLVWKCNSTGWWIEDTDGWYPVSSWQKIDGFWYYFGSSGYMAASEWIDGYWLSSNGALEYEGSASWKSDATGWWFEDTSGWWAVNCWQKINESWYYFKADGYMATSQYVDGYWIGSDGICQ